MEAIKKHYGLANVQSVCMYEHPDGTVYTVHLKNVVRRVRHCRIENGEVIETEN